MPILSLGNIAAIFMLRVSNVTDSEAFTKQLNALFSRGLNMLPRSFFCVRNTFSRVSEMFRPLAYTN